VTRTEGPPDLREGPGFRSWRRGAPMDGRSNPVGGVMLEGGAGDVEQAWRWFLERAGHGDIVVLRATPDEGYDAWIRELAPVRSFQTLQLTDRAAADDPFVLGSIERADGLFIAGGDQYDYVRVWTGTPIQRAINAAIAAGGPVGGISAGLAVLGGFAFTAERDTITSEEALADPFDERVCLASGLLRVPGLEAAITDSHFSERERLGRLLTFTARILADGWASELGGIGIDEETAVLIEPDGTATVEGAGAAWFMRMHAADVRTCGPATPLETGPIEAIAIRRGGTFHVPTWTGSGASQTVRATAGSVRRTDP
jgi:cyanophycinase